MPRSDRRIHEMASVGFQLAADSYERGRPDYPDAAATHLIDVLGITAGSRVVELGAGTGKFTKRLLETGAEIIAVEPVEAMRGKLRELLPSVRVVDGTAEAVPLPDASVAAVVAAQSFHWFRASEALVEIHRLLKSTGRLGLIWNVRDESIDWIRKLTDIIEPHEQGVPRFKSMEWKRALEVSGLFSPLREADFPYVQRASIETLIDRVASISFIAALPQEERDQVLESVRELLRTDPATRSRTQIDFPYRTHVYWCKKA